MLNSVSHLRRATVAATDGDIGPIKQVFFDDQRWVIRYLIVDTGSWLTGREVLISPYAVTQPLPKDPTVAVRLTRKQVQASPDIDTHQPVSRRHEQDYLRYYAYPDYWDGSGLWAMGELPMLPPTPPAGPAGAQAAIDARSRAEHVPTEDVHLRSSAEVDDYRIQAADGSIGHVEDFIFDDESWAIRYLLVNTNNWWPGGRKVLVAVSWISSIEWADKAVYVTLTREQIKDSPAYDENVTIDRDYEQRLHESYNRVGYWP